MGTRASQSSAGFLSGVWKRNRNRIVGSPAAAEIGRHMNADRGGLRRPSSDGDVACPGSPQHPTDPSLRGLFMPQARPDGFHRPTATLGEVRLGGLLNSGSACRGPGPPRSSSASRSPSEVPKAAWPSSDPCRRLSSARRSKSAGKSQADGRHSAPSSPSQGPRQPVEAGPRSELHCVASSTVISFHPQARHENSLTRLGSRFGKVARGSS